MKKHALTFIFITLLIDVTGIGIIIPVFPKLLESMVPGGLSEAALYGGLLAVSYSFMQFLFAPVLGGLSDQYGRRPVLLGSLFGFGVDYLFLAFAPTVGWLFLGRLLAGITGASFTTASAYIADVSTPEKRSQNFGLIGAAFGLGFILGPAIGGLLGQYGARIPFFVSAGLTLVNWLYGYFVLPESLSPENRRPFSWKRANPAGSLRQLRKYPLIISLVAALVCIYIAGQAPQSTWTYVTMEKYGWNERTVGLSLAAIGLMAAIVQGGLTRFLIPRLGQARSVYVGLSLYGIGLLCFAFAGQTWIMFVSIIPYSLGGIAGPALQGIISNQVPRNEQGELQGAQTSLISLTAIAGPFIMTNLFSYFTRPGTPAYFPGAPFLAAAGFIVGGLILARRSLVAH